MSYKMKVRYGFRSVRIPDVFQPVTRVVSGPEAIAFKVQRIATRLWRRCSQDHRFRSSANRLGSLQRARGGSEEGLLPSDGEHPAPPETQWSTKRRQRFARRHSAARPSASVQNRLSPLAVSMWVFAYEAPPGTW